MGQWAVKNVFITKMKKIHMAVNIWLFIGRNFNCTVLVFRFDRYVVRMYCSQLGETLVCGCRMFSVPSHLVATKHKALRPFTFRHPLPFLHNISKYQHRLIYSPGARCGAFLDTFRIMRIVYFSVTICSGAK